MKDLISVSGLEDQGLEVYTRLSEVQLKHYYNQTAGFLSRRAPRWSARAGLAAFRFPLWRIGMSGAAAEVIAAAEC